MKRRRPLGQHFLVDTGIAGEIIRAAGVSPNERVVEIGPGKGILTEILLRQGVPLTAIEIDPKLCDGLQKRFGSHPDFQLLQADALKFDYSALGQNFKVISNLPYYAATPILKRLIRFRSRITGMTLMLQKEVVNRLAARPGQKEYGSLTVFIQYHCDVEKLFEIKKSSFNPPPKIDSAVVNLVPIGQPRVKVEDESVFFSIVHAAFLHKRKMLKNNLKHWEKQFLVDRDKIHLAEIDLTRRGETLSIQDFASISNYIHQKSA